MGFVYKYFTKFVAFNLLLLFHSPVLNCQVNTDSLRRIIWTTKSDRVKITGYNSLCDVYFSKNNFLSKKYADSALSVINSFESKNDTTRFYQLQKAYTYDKLGGIVYQEGKFNEAVQYCMKALKINEKYNTKEKIAISLGNIGGILKAIGNKEALSYYKQSVKIHEENFINDKKNNSFRNSLANAYHNTGATFAYFNNYDSSMFYFKKSLSLLDSTKKTVNLAIVYTGIAQANKMINKYTSAIGYNKKALHIYRKISSPDGIVSTYNGFADIYLDAKDYKNAIHYSDSAEKISIANNFSDELLYSYETRFLAYEKLKDIKNEMLFLKKHVTLKDSLSKQNHILQIEELKTQYETEKKENEIVKLNKDNKIQELQLNRLIIIIISIAVVVILLVWLAFFLVKTIRERKKAYIKLQEKNIEIQKQGEQLNEQSKLISKYQSQMNPHFVFNALNSIQGNVLNDEKDKTLSQLQLFSQLMRQTLNNSENETITLETEINYLITYVEFEQQKFKTALKFEVHHPEDCANILIPPMMIQPFIENAIKHAGLQILTNSLISLNITTHDNLLKVVIKDNGKGFSTEDSKFFKSSHAVKIIQSRLQLIFQAANTELKHEYFEIQSKPKLETGTEIKFYLPLNYKY